MLAENTRIGGHTQSPFELDVDKAPYQRASEYGDTPDLLKLYVRDFHPSLIKPLADAQLADMAARATPWQDVMGMLVHIPQDSAAALKTECAPAPPEFASTYDCVSALLYRTVIRARLRTGRVRAEEATGNWHTVNVRKRAPEAREAYFGNAVALCCVAPMTVGELAGEDGLRRAALDARRAIRDTNMLGLRKFVEAHLTLGREGALNTSSAFMTTGAMATSWQQIRLAAFDFGFGRPRAFRSPGVCVDGGMILFPTLPGDGIVAWIGSSEECIEAMQRDPELLRYGEVWGVEKVL